MIERNAVGQREVHEREELRYVFLYSLRGVCEREMHLGGEGEVWVYSWRV